MLRCHNKGSYPEQTLVVLQSVPEVGKVTEVEPVAVMVIGNAPAVEKASAKATFLVEARVRVSVPPKVIELVARVVESDKVSTLLFPRVIEEVASVVESEAVRVFPFEMVNVPVELVIVKPLMLVAVAAPKAGVTSVGVFSLTILPVPV